jgi:uncharacterized protein YuzE
MKLTYDPVHNVAYIRFREQSGTVDTLNISDEINIDLGSDGKIYGIELLNANEQLKNPSSSVIVLNEALGRVQELPLG